MICVSLSTCAAVVVFVCRPHYCGKSPRVAAHLVQIDPGHVDAVAVHGHVVDVVSASTEPNPMLGVDGDKVPSAHAYNGSPKAPPPLPKDGTPARKYRVGV